MKLKGKVYKTVVRRALLYLIVQTLGQHRKDEKHD